MKNIIISLMLALFIFSGCGEEIKEDPIIKETPYCCYSFIVNDSETLDVKRTEDKNDCREYLHNKYQNNIDNIIADAVFCDPHKYNCVDCAPDVFLDYAEDQYNDYDWTW